jgi:dTDP-glucose pyrophosphorylase
MSRSNDVLQFTIALSATLRDLLVTLERGAEIALVTHEGRFVGVMTDGDARRALLAGHSLESPLAPHVNRNGITVGPAVGRAEVLELMQAHTIGQVPIVDAHGVLHGLHRLHDILGVRARPNRAVVMAGGRGTRLAPLTDQVPKPMLRVAGRPILERIVLHLISHGIRDVALSVNYLGHIIEEHFGDGSRFGARITYLREERALGTGGPLAQLDTPPTEPLVVMNGDLVTQVDLGAMLDFHDDGAQLATMGVRRYLHTVPFGCIDTDGDGYVTQFEEKPTLTRMVNAGIYVLSPELVARVPKGQEFPITRLFEGCLARGERVRTFEIVDDWVDVGQRDQLRQARGGGTHDA